MVSKNDLVAFLKYSKMLLNYYKERVTLNLMKIEAFQKNKTIKTGTKCTD